MCRPVLALVCLAWAGQGRRVQTTAGRQHEADRPTDADVLKSLGVLVAAENPESAWQVPGSSLSPTRRHLADPGSMHRMASFEQAPVRRADVDMQHALWEEDSMIDNEEEKLLQPKKVVLAEELREKRSASEEEEEEEEEEDFEEDEDRFADEAWPEDKEADWDDDEEEFDADEKSYFEQKYGTMGSEAEDDEEEFDADEKSYFEQKYGTMGSEAEDDQEAWDEDEEPSVDEEENKYAWAKQEPPEFQFLLRTLMEDMPEIIRRDPRFSVFRQRVRLDHITGESIQGITLNRNLFQFIAKLRKKFIVRDDIKFIAKSRDDLRLRIKIEARWRKTPLPPKNWKKKGRKSQGQIVTPFKIDVELKFHVDEEHLIDTYAVTRWKVNGKENVKWPDIDLYGDVNSNMKALNRWARTHNIKEQPIQVPQACVHVAKENVPCPILVRRLNETEWKLGYPSVDQASKALGIPRQCIIQVCKSSRKQYYGYVFRKLNNPYQKTRKRDGF